LISRIKATVKKTKERIDLMNDGWDLVDKMGVDWYFRKPK
jgi:hypothetical protein